jgi:hypothetical protein
MASDTFIPPLCSPRSFARLSTIFPQQLEQSS